MSVEASGAAVPEAPQAESRRRHPEQSAAQVFARDRRLGLDAPLVFLAPRQAETLREDARAGHLVCPLGDCRDNRFIVYGGTERRHHFKHRSGAGHHAPETIAHHTAKHLVARWLRHLFPAAQVFPDTREVETGQRPDVLLVLEDGTRVAYEVQFAALTAAGWQTRRDRYASEEIRNVWLFGGKTYDRPGRAGEGVSAQVPLHPVFRAVLAAMHPMLLIDPFTETVAVGSGRDVDMLLTTAGVQVPELLFPKAMVGERLPLMSMPASKGVIELPGVRDQIQRARDGHARWLERLRREAEAQAGAEAAERRRQPAVEEAERRARLHQEDLARERAKGDRPRDRADEARQRRADILTTELRRRSDRWRPERERLEKHLGSLPAVVDGPVEDPEIATTPAAPDQWRWAVLEALADHHGFAVDPRGLADLVPLQRAARRADAQRIVTGYLDDLRAAGWVWYWGARGPRAGEAALVLARLGETPRRPPAAALRVVGARVAGPGPGGMRYLASDGTPSMRTVDQARQVGPEALTHAWSEAHVAEVGRAVLAALAGGDALALPQRDAGSPTLDLSAVYRVLPDARVWCAAQSWPEWPTLPSRLREVAKLTLYVLEKVQGGHSQQAVRLAGCSDEDTKQALDALRCSGYITDGAMGWQTTFGGRL